MLEFPTRGRRSKPGGGLQYVSSCGRYAVHKSDQVEGVPLHPVRWLAVTRAPLLPGVISWHRTKHRAIAACESHARKLAQTH